MGMSLAGCHVYGRVSTRGGRLLGLSQTGVLTRIHIPLMQGSVLTAILVCFVDILKELPATLILRPFDFNTLAVRAYELAGQERLLDAFSSLTMYRIGRACSCHSAKSFNRKAMNQQIKTRSRFVT